MTKTKQKIVTDPAQMSLFDLLSQKKEEQAAVRAGRGCTSSRIQAAQRLAARNAHKSRDQLADEMSELEGKIITVDMLNNWLSDSHPHRMPGEYYSSFCQASGNTEIIRILAESLGLHILEGPDALRADMQRDVERKKELDKQIRQKEALIKALEDGK